LRFGTIANFDAPCEADFFGFPTDVPPASFLAPDLVVTADLVTPIASDLAPALLPGRAAGPFLGAALRGGNFDVAGLVFRAM
jgi:hypothetical protein